MRNSDYMLPPKSDNPMYHNTWRLMKKYRDVRWSLEVFVLQAKTLSIRHTVIGEGKYRYCEDRTKTQSSARTLHLVPQVEERLKKVYAQQKGYGRSAEMATSRATTFALGKMAN